MTEDKMLGWHQLDGCEFDQVLGDGEGQGSLVCGRASGHKESDTTEQQQQLSDDGNVCFQATLSIVLLPALCSQVCSLCAALQYVHPYHLRKIIPNVCTITFSLFLV